MRIWISGMIGFFRFAISLGGLLMAAAVSSICFLPKSVSFARNWN
jgi:hypothetical protein